MPGAYLDDALLETSSLALDRVRLEIGHMGNRVIDMLEQIMPAIPGGNRGVAQGGRKN